MTEATDRTQYEARERYLGGGGLAASVRPEIGASWRRSQLSGVPADRLPDIAVSDVETENRLLRAAASVLDRLSDEIHDFSMSLLLTDGNARILDRRVGVRHLQAQLDDVTAVPGAKFAEDAVGTNGVGTCVETRRPIVVSGGEHFTEALRHLTCAAAPIVHPISGRIEGVLDVTSRSDDANGLMLAFVREAAGEIRRRLEELASETERALLHHFLPAARRSSHPVLSVSGELIIANAAAAHLLEPGDHERLWDQLSRSLDAAGDNRDVVLGDGVPYRADIVPIAVGGRPVGALVRLPERSQRASARTKDDPPALPGLVGESRPWRDVCREVHAVARSRLGVVVVGADGAGKLAVARCLHAAGDPAAPLDVVDAGIVPAAERAWLDRLQVRAQKPGTLIIRRLELLPPRLASTVAAICSQAETRVVATADEAWPASVPRRLVDQFPARVTVPPLRDRGDDVPSLVAELIRRHAANPAAVRMRPDALRALARQPWPGNVRELEGVVRLLLLRRQCGDITLGDLPIDYQTAGCGDGITDLQRLEREAIVRALDAEHGNKHAAAARLGISRSTLYRRLGAYHLGGDHSS